MDLEEIKSKFKHKSQVDIKDLDLALRAAPALIREVERLEAALKTAEERLAHLSTKIKHQPPKERKGEKGGGSWETRVDEEKNRLFLKLAGRYNYRNAKTASNHVLSMLVHLREGFDVVNDISEMHPEFEKKAAFHLRKITYNLGRHGVNHIVVVSNPEAPLLDGIFSMKLPNVSYRLTKVKTADEAVSLLDNVRFLKS